MSLNLPQKSDFDPSDTIEVWDKTGSDPQKKEISGVDWPNTKKVDTISDLKNEEPSLNGVVLVKGYNTVDDGGGGIFWWDDGANASAANGGTTIESNLTKYASGGNKEGRWQRQEATTQDVILAQWWGAEDGTDSTSEIQSALNFARDRTSDQLNKVVLPDGRYTISSRLTVHPETVFTCDGVLVPATDGQNLVFMDGGAKANIRADTRPVTYSGIVLDLDGGISTNDYIPNQSEGWSAEFTLDARGIEGRGTSVRLKEDGNTPVTFVKGEVNVNGFENAALLNATATGSGYINSNRIDFNVWNSTRLINMMGPGAIDSNLFNGVYQSASGSTEAWLIQSGASNATRNVFQGKIWDIYNFSNAVLQDNEGNSGSTNIVIAPQENIKDSRITGSFDVIGLSDGLWATQMVIGSQYNPTRSGDVFRTRGGIESLDPGNIKGRTGYMWEPPGGGARFEMNSQLASDRGQIRDPTNNAQVLTWQDNPNFGPHQFRREGAHRHPEATSPPSNPQNGDIIYADGTNWDPGSGEGFYGHEAGSWVKL